MLTSRPFLAAGSDVKLVVFIFRREWPIRAAQAGSLSRGMLARLATIGIALLGLNVFWTTGVSAPMNDHREIHGATEVALLGFNVF